MHHKLTTNEISSRGNYDAHYSVHNHSNARTHAHALIIFLVPVKSNIPANTQTEWQVDSSAES